MAGLVATTMLLGAYPAVMQPGGNIEPGRASLDRRQTTSERWCAAEATGELLREFPRVDLDDSDWRMIEVPGHWRSNEAFANSDGPLLYRHRFSRPVPASGLRSWLVLKGIFYQGDVWLDGSYLGDTEGYFFAHSFEVTEHLAKSPEHLLAIEVSCTPPADRRAKHNLTGVFEHWDCIDPDWNPGGIWQPVVVEQTGPVRITSLQAVCREATPERARLDISAVFDSADATTVMLTTTLRRAETPEPTTTVADKWSEHPLAAGSNRLRWTLVVERPDLWWPASLGSQPLYDLEVAVAVAADPEPDGSDVEGPPRPGDQSDQRVLRTGLRQVRMRNFVTTINGERLFLKGANYGPTDRALAEATPDAIERDLKLARDAGLDLLRVHGHIAHPALYDIADRIGMLVWQDLPLQWGYSHVRKQATRQARRAVTEFGHHPSIIIWCGHNEPFDVDLAPGATVDRVTAMRYAAAQMLPSANKTRLDSSIRRALERADPSRPVIANSGVLPHPLWGTDSHLYHGWYQGEVADLAHALARMPVLARFVGEFGAQAVPDSAEFMQPWRWPDLDWDGLARHHGLQRELLDRRVRDRGGKPSDSTEPTVGRVGFEQWRDATQDYQAELIRRHIETLRRLKYRPAGGFCQFLFSDSQAAVSWSVLDHERVAKVGYSALAKACRPVVVVADWPEPSYRPGGTIALNVHIVSDLRNEIEGARVTAEISWPGGSRRWHFGGDVGADTCVRVGRVELALPTDTPEGPITMDLGLQWQADREAKVGSETLLDSRVEDRQVTNVYLSQVQITPNR